MNNSKMLDSNMFLLPVDPARGWQVLVTDVETFRRVDPNLQWCYDAVVARFQELSEEEASNVGAIGWLSISNAIAATPYGPPLNICPPWVLPHGTLPPLLQLARTGLASYPHKLRKLIEELLGTSLTVESLRSAAQEVESFSAIEANAEGSQAIQRARARMNELSSTTEEVAPVLVAAAAIGFIAGVAAGIAWEHYHHLQ